MTARKVFSIIIMVLLVYLFANMFIPAYSGYTDVSLWDYFGEESVGKIILIVELVLGILVCTLQLCGVLKDSKGVYLSVGYLFTFYLSDFFTAIKYERMDILAVGFWLGFIVSVLVVLLTFIGNLLSNEVKKRVPATPQRKGPEPKITGYDPKTGEPIYATPIGYDPKTGEPVYGKLTGYDPKTGEPIYEKE